MPASRHSPIPYAYGPFIALCIVVAWFGCLAIGLSWHFDWRNPLSYLLILLQTHLYTGLFITAHDGMHGTISRNKKWNDTIAAFCALLVAFNIYPRLRRKHFLHHDHVASQVDPDYHTGSFWPWYFRFIRNYLTWYQFLLMGIAFNILKLWFSELNIALYWMVPAILSTLQLFYFGTYLPHKGEHAADNRHKARSQRRNHLWAFVSCYFFGYHYEHHDKPFVPWWMLYKEKAS